MSKRRLRVYIVAEYKKPYIELFTSKEAGDKFVGTMNIIDADIVLFGGGPDINPELYGETKIQQTNISPIRDVRDLEAWKSSSHALRLGICRGAQFLNVMNGGKLFQHVTDHQGGHMIYDLQTGQNLWASSTHHQMMIPTKDAVCIAHARVSRLKRTDHSEWHRPTVVDAKSDDPNLMDWEILSYEDTSSFCFQPHPEHAGVTDVFRKYFFQKLGTAYAVHEFNKEKAA